MTAVTQKSDEPKGIGGWLAFLITILIIISPVHLAWSTYREMPELIEGDPELISDPELALYVKIFIWFVTFILSLVSIITGIILLKMRKPKAVKIAIASLWLVGPIFALPILIYAYMENPNSIYSSEYSEYSRGILIAILWTAYLMMSKRVKNTYGFRVKVPKKHNNGTPK